MRTLNCVAYVNHLGEFCILNPRMTWNRHFFRIGEVVSRPWWLWVQGSRCQIGHKERPISSSQQYCALLLSDLLECIGMPNCRDPTTEPLPHAISNEIWQGNDLLRVGHLCWWIFWNFYVLNPRMTRSRHFFSFLGFGGVESRSWGLWMSRITLPN